MTKCPVCRKTFAESAAKPFCSKRCADLDLSRWLNGVYTIPGEPVDPESQAEWGMQTKPAQES